MAASIGSRMLHLCSKRTFKRFSVQKRLTLNENLYLSSSFDHSSYNNGFHTCSQHMDAEKRPVKAEKISRAMRLYMERAKAYDEFMQVEIEEYELGKRHLANIMGEDPDDFTQADIDKAIEYLLPSGLFDKKARPIFKHPYDIFPLKKAAQFGMDGRPHHFLFYTGRPQLFEVLHDINAKLNELIELELHMQKQPNMQSDKLKPSIYKKLDISGLKNIIGETVPPQYYTHFCILLDRLLSHPLAGKAEDFIKKYATKLDTKLKGKERVKPEVDDDGREFIKAIGKRKSSVAEVILWDKGSGEITINGQDLTYFKNVQDKNQLLFPLKVADKVGKVDISCSVREGGPSGQAGAIRLAISKALCSFIHQEEVDKLRLAGLLTYDPRVHERKKTSQPGARKKQTWKKR